MLARHDVAGARAASDELVVLADRIDAPFLRAVGVAGAGACSCWRKAKPARHSTRCIPRARHGESLDAPYELAQVRVLIGLAYRQLGDEDGAQLEFDAAHDAFERLGATPDAAAVAALTAPPSTPTLDEPDRARGRGAPAHRDRRHEPGDCRPAGHQREDRRPSREQHLHQAGFVVTGGGHCLRVRAQAALVVIRRASPLGLPYTRPRAPFRPAPSGHVARSRCLHKITHAASRRPLGIPADASRATLDVPSGIRNS